MTSEHLRQHQKRFTTLDSIAVPRVMRTVAWLLAVMSVAILAFLIYVPWVQTAPGSGSVTALNPNDRLQEINALVSGRIDQWYVQDGSRVRVGDPIVKIVDNDPLLLERLDAQRRQVQAQLDAANTAEDIAQLDLERTERLFEDGLASRRDMEQARIRMQELRSRVAENAAELSRVEVEASRQSLQIVHAPRDGVIQRVNAGDTATFIAAGHAIATFVPDDVERAVALFIDGRDIALIREGAEVRLQFEGWPVVQVSGWPSQAVGTFAGRVVAIDPSADAEGRFRLLVAEDTAAAEPWPDRTYVRFGSAARGWVLLETVTVGFELWRQLNNFPPNFPRETGVISAE